VTQLLKRIKIETKKNNFFLKKKEEKPEIGHRVLVRDSIIFDFD